MVTIEQKLEMWKNNLLDLGRRNRLLNYKDSAKSNLKITYPSADELYSELVDSESPLSFPMPDYEDEIDEVSGDKDFKELLPKKEEDYGDDTADLRTNRPVKDLQSILRKLRSKAKLAMEEQGINVLFLSFGFLRWKESEHSEISYKSPLILVPVTLTQTSLLSPYMLDLHEDEIVVNPTLAYKLQTDFGITLPPFDEETNPSDYFCTVYEIVKNQNWAISTEVGLNLLSFLKINMYSDLNKHHDEVISNPVIRALNGDKSGVVQVPDGIDVFDFDKQTDPKEVFQVMDADSSQQEAILLAKKGVSFVLQGPPGTGKSQTISNIIAESLADGKKVLFVSEKMAALDVVRRRLSAAGLDDFCLVLHSHKANKRSVLEQLEKVLGLSRQKATLSGEIYRKLDELVYDRKKLNDYAEQVYTPVQPLGRTIYEANGIVANLDSVTDIIFPIEGVRETTPEKYNEYLRILGQYSKTIGSMTNDFRFNPWHDSKLPAVTNEFRHDAGAILPETIRSLTECGNVIDSAYAKILSVYPRNAEGIASAVRLLDSLNGSHEIPIHWIIGTRELPVSEEIETVSKKQEECRSIAVRLRECIEWLSGYCVIGTMPEEEMYLVEKQDERIAEIERILDYKEPYYRWRSEDFEDIVKLFDEAKKTADEIGSEIGIVSGNYEDGIYDIDYEGILGRFRTEYTSFTRIFKKQYQEDKKTFLINCRQIRKKITDAEMIDTINKLRSIREKKGWFVRNEVDLNEAFGSDITSENGSFDEVEKQLTSYRMMRQALELLKKLNLVSRELALSEEQVRADLGNLYQGMGTDWTEACESWEWAKKFRTAVEAENPSPVFVEKVCGSKEYAGECLEIRKVLADTADRIRESIAWFAKDFIRPDQFLEEDIRDLRDRVESCLNGMQLLEEWIDYRNVRKEAYDSGLRGYIEAIETDYIDTSDIIPIFKKRFFRLWLDAVLPDYPAVFSFRRKNQEATVKDFSELDVLQFEIARARIKSKLINDLPSLDHITSGVDEIGILKREIAKTSRNMPIRKLFRAIPNLLLTLKPCLMMSPLSVSLFLEADSYQFDIVIFDEASQVYTENAIGAIFRGKQVVIAGDSKQLPPTNFFRTAVSENDFDSEDGDDYDDGAPCESILDEAGMLPEKTLKWHYRSRHESLIAFSNAKLYKNSLVTFPSNIERGPNNGVEFIYVPGGYYDRGGRKGNPVEAEKIAQLVFDHFAKHPNRSLGVITFGEVQQIAVEDALKKLRIAHSEYEPFFDESREEPFFVKSLENVQGDERDTIIFSIGYAPDVTGVFRMNFGPLGKSGGERRLNVAITRAKYNVKLVGSIQPQDINLDSVTMEGPKLLRAYMEYAINGEMSLKREVTSDDVVKWESPFEESVYNFLDRNGYRLATQVGCSGYRVDIGVRHPNDKSVFVLGIECDGASYHSARTARERDRLRQSVLEKMGWKIYRIWSTDWIKDRATEGEKLLEVVEQAIADYDAGDQNLYSSSGSLKKVSSFVEIEKKDDADVDKSNPYGFPKYAETVLKPVPRDVWGNVDFEECVMEVIKNEYPIHFDLLCKRMTGPLDYEKATANEKHQVEGILTKMSGYKREGDFFFPAGYTDIPVRMPNCRPIQYICTKELASAMMTILGAYVGATRQILIAETARVYGFARTGAQIGQAMQKAIEYLIENRIVEEIDGKLRIIS